MSTDKTGYRKDVQNMVLANTDVGKHIVQLFFRFNIVSHCLKFNGTSHLTDSFTFVALLIWF
jgi:hypothetical protein